jgi:co-chaperonin GroES (HSP10)
MECSNRGVCDRKTGECECFDGYTGLGCNRLACPENCAGHGTCQTVAQMGAQQPTLQSFTVQTYKDVATVDCEIDVSSLIYANDYVTIGSHPPMKVASVSATVITLKSEVPESLPYGTHIWKVHKYELWDATKNTACKCDAMWTGNDCSLRKCPYGDDPLTVVSYDMEQEGTDASSAGQTGSDTAVSALYAGYSPYRQRAERQTLYIDSATHTNTGTFALTFTDEYGDDWTTRPIPTVVRLSQTLSAAASSGDTELSFGNTPGIRVSEVNIGDIIRVGSAYRKVTKLEYRRDSAGTLDASRQFYQKIHFTTGVPAFSAKTAQAAEAYRTAGSPVYRVTISQEIRQALRALPNDRIPDVTVEAITRGGHAIDQTTRGTAITDGTIIHLGNIVKRKVSVGDIIRYENEYRQVSSVTDKTTYVVAKEFVASIPLNSTMFIQNGMAYDITFEAGCRSHEDCRYNGVDENDSDGPPTDRLIEGVGSNGAYCHMGGSCMCSFNTNEQATFFGPGCTKTGRGTHKNAKVTVSGDIYNLKCDATVRVNNGVSTGLTPSYVHAETATVARVSPQTVTVTGAVPANVNVGDHIRIENQVRTVTSTANNKIEVDTPFEEVATSDIVNIFPALSPINVIKEIGGVRSTCTVSDLRRLTDTKTSCDSLPSSTTQIAACGKYSVIAGSADQTRRGIETTTAGFVMDEREVEIGDRIRVVTAAGKWQTRTVDSVTYDSGEVNGFVVSEPYEAAATDLELYNDGAGTTEAKTCSGRGLCDDSSGECQCFKGYSGVDCSRQNALAV